MISVQSVMSNVRSALGEFFSTENNSDQDILNYIQSSIDYITSMRDWEFLNAFQDVVYSTPGSYVSITELIKCDRVVRAGATDEISIYGVKDWYLAGDDACLVTNSKFMAKISGTYTLTYQMVLPRITKDSTLDVPAHFQTSIENIATYYGQLVNDKEDEGATNRLQTAISVLNGFANRHTKTNQTKKTGDITMGINVKW